jgi:hypothetical protein
MKILRTVLIAACLVFTLPASHAFADSGDPVRIMVREVGDGSTAKVTLDSGTYRVPIGFESGLSWSDVKDAYSIPPAYAELLKQGRIRMYITCGGAEFHVLRR